MDIKVLCNRKECFETVAGRLCAFICRHNLFCCVKKVVNFKYTLFCKLCEIECSRFQVYFRSTVYIVLRAGFEPDL